MRKRIALILSVMILLLSAIASLGGILWKSLYNDNDFVKSVWVGNDIITILFAIPIAVFSIILSFKGSLKATLIWAGALWYMIYNYLFYMYGAAFNEFFLLYVFVFILSLCAFVLLFSDLMINDLVQKSTENTNLPVKRIAVYMLFFAVFIGSMWIIMSLNFIFTQKIPIGITQTGHPTSVVFATDLSFLVTPLLLSAILLIKKNYLGYLMASIILVKCLLYPLVLVVGGLIAFNNTGVWDSLTPAYFALGVGCFICLFSLLKGIESNNLTGSTSSESRT